MVLEQGEHGVRPYKSVGGKQGNRTLEPYGQPISNRCPRPCRTLSKSAGTVPRRSGSCTVFAVLKFVGLDKTKEGFRFEPSSGLPGDLARSRTENFFVCSEDPCRMARDHWGKGRDSNPHKGTVALRKLASCGKLRTHSRTLRTRVASRRAQRAAVHCIRNP